MRTSTVATIAAGLTAAGATVLTVWMLTPAGQAQRVTPPAAGRAVDTRASVSADAGGFHPGASAGLDSAAPRSAAVQGGGLAALDAARLSIRSAGPSATVWRSDDHPFTGVREASGETAGSGTTASVSGTNRPRFLVRKFDTPPVLPVAFQEPPGDGVALTPPLAAGVESVQDQFIADIGGDPTDPSSSDYFEKWQRAQPVADYRLRAMIGAQAFAAWQAEAYLRSRQERTGK